MNAQDRPIAIFDSGVGGLTVMRAIVDLLPAENVIYLGDTARVPYGNRGADTVRRYALNAAHLLTRYDIKALVVACNTATAYALPALVDRYRLPVVGVVEPVARTAAATTRTGKVGVIGTRGTVASLSYPATLERLRPGVAVHQIACPLLVPLAEEGWTEGVVVESVLARYLEGFKGTDIDTLILGCTHYPLLTDAIGKAARRALDRPITLLDSAAATARTLHDTLAGADALRTAADDGYRRFLLTDIPEGFLPTAQRFFGSDIASCEHVDILDTTHSSPAGETP